MCGESRKVSDWECWAEAGGPCNQSVRLDDGPSRLEFDLPIAVLASLEAMFVVLLPIEKLKLDVGNEEFELPLAKAGSSL